MLNCYLRQTLSPIFLTNCDRTTQTLLRHLLHLKLPQRHPMISVHHLLHLHLHQQHRLMSVHLLCHQQFPAQLHKSAPDASIPPCSHNLPISNAPPQSPSQPAPQIVTRSGRVVRKPARYSDWLLISRPSIAGGEHYPLLWVPKECQPWNCCMWPYGWCWHWQFMTLYDWTLIRTGHLELSQTLMIYIFSALAIVPVIVPLTRTVQVLKTKKRRHVTSHASRTRLPIVLFSCTSCLAMSPSW